MDMLIEMSVDTVVTPINRSWSVVFTLDIVVGRTSAEGMEKSQYLWKVLGGGKLVYRT